MIKKTASILMVLLWALAAHAQQALTPADLGKDHGRLQALIAAHGDTMKTLAGRTESGKDKAEKYKNYLLRKEQIAQFNGSARAEITAALKDFAGKYGSTRREIRARFKQINGGRNWLAPTRHVPESGFDVLSERLANIDAFAPGAAATLLRNVESSLKHAWKKPNASTNMDSVDKNFAESKVSLETAIKLDPKNASIGPLLNSLDQRREDILKAVMADIETREWPPHSARFSGPGDADDLALAVKDYLSLRDDGSYSDSIIGVRISGDWRIGEKNILGQAINYGLPVHVAHRSKKYPELASVSSLTIITRDAVQAPPFKHQWVGDFWKVKRDKIPEMSGGSAGLFGMIWRIGLALALLLSGLLAAASFVSAKAPALKGVLDKLSPLRPIIGVVTLGVGAAFFVGNFLSLSPLANILPQGAAMLVGLMLGMELLMKKPVGSMAASGAAQDGAVGDAAEKAGQVADQATAKAQELLRKNQARIKKLDKFQVPIGLACMVLALLHLFAGGVALI